MKYASIYWHPIIDKEQKTGDNSPILVLRNRPASANSNVASYFPSRKRSGSV
jgi:hypothetical protein